jgi:hypothetical protein
VLAVAAALLADAPERWRRRAFQSALALTALWALAFHGIYRTEHPRVAASRWMAAALPPGAALAHEPWDDVLPLPLAGVDSARFERIEIPLYGHEDEIKRLGLAAARRFALGVRRLDLRALALSAGRRLRLSRGPGLPPRCSSFRGSGLVRQLERRRSRLTTRRSVFAKTGAYDRGASSAARRAPRHRTRADAGLVRFRQALPPPCAPDLGTPAKPPPGAG